MMQTQCGGTGGPALAFLYLRLETSHSFISKSTNAAMLIVSI